MTPEQQAAFIMAMAAGVMAETAAMQAANACAAAAGLPPAHAPQEFLDLPLRYGTHHNAVIGYFTGR